MAGELHAFLANDHDRLDGLLQRCRNAESEEFQETYAEFRRGLLRHIGIEERVLFPLIRKQHGITPLDQQLHRDHAALAALLVPGPTPAGIDQISAILEAHNLMEEKSGGLYEIVEQLAGTELKELMSQVHAIPQIPPAPFSDTPLLRRTIELLVREAEEGRRRL